MSRLYALLMFPLLALFFVPFFLPGYYERHPEWPFMLLWGFVMVGVWLWMTIVSFREKI